MKKISKKIPFLIFTNIIMILGIIMIFSQKKVYVILISDLENLRIDQTIYLIYAVLLIFMGIICNLVMFIMYAYRTLRHEK